MIVIHGASDDVVEITGSTWPESEIGCYNKDVRIHFVDGTVIRIGYPKADKAIWWIRVEQKGSATQILTKCDNEDDEYYTDVFEIGAEIRDVEIIPKTSEDNRPSQQDINCKGCHHLHPTNGNCMAVGGFCTAVPAAHCPLIPELRAEIASLKDALTFYG